MNENIGFFFVNTSDNAAVLEGNAYNVGVQEREKQQKYKAQTHTHQPP